MPRALKVFRTSAGFHDAYVAAPSQKAALEAWGSASNLFATGQAEVVTDPKFTKQPLAKPGQVIKVVRGTTAQHFAALPKENRNPKLGVPRDTDSGGKVAKPTIRPSRRALDAAEKELCRADEEYRKASDTFRKREAALRRERAALDDKHEVTRAKLSRKVDDIRTDYEHAMDQWRG